VPVAGDKPKDMFGIGVGTGVGAGVGDPFVVEGTLSL
jgi:hypothetical protein